MIHSYNQFHAAGHGTFFSGQLKSSEESQFLWVYDCGSKRSGRMAGLVQDLEDHSKSGLIQMLCISHFDGDHVNGLVALLNKFTVECLFLPYLPFNKRLLIAAELDIDDAGSVDAMLFTLDPAGFLAARNLSNKVKSIVLVKGGKGSVGGELRDINNTPQGGGEREERVEDIHAQSDEHYQPLLNNGAGSGVTSISHTTALAYQGIWEFTFYNRELPDGVTPVSGATLGGIHKEVGGILGKWNLKSGIPQQIEGWRKDLRKCYDKHFGNTSKGRNDISLCVLSRPVEIIKIDRCSIFDSPSSRLGCAHTLVPVSNENKTGLLLVGDLSVGFGELQHMENHFGKGRWSDIHVMQVPHHGSSHSWETGSSAACQHEYSVLCVPDRNPKGLHPHESVLQDLEDRFPLRADYSNSVVYAFHVHLNKSAQADWW